MPLFTIQEAQDNLEANLIALAQNGEEVFIADGQNAVVQLIASLSRQERMRVPGQDGRIAELARTSNRAAHALVMIRGWRYEPG